MSRALQSEIAVLKLGLLVEQVPQPRLLDLLLRDHQLVRAETAVQEMHDIEDDHVPRGVIVRVGLGRHGEQEVEDALAREGDDQVGLELRVFDRSRGG